MTIAILTSVISDTRIQLGLQVYVHIDGRPWQSIQQHDQQMILWGTSIVRVLETLMPMNGWIILNPKPILTGITMNELNIFAIIVRKE